MADERTQLREARRIINQLSRTCRQTQVFFEGASALDKQRVIRNLKDAIRMSDRFLNN